MLNKETYAILKKEIEKDTLNENDLKNLNADLSQLLIHLYLEKNYPKIKAEISHGKRFQNLFMKVVRDKISYYIGSFSCILNLFELLVNRTNKTLSFREQMLSLYTKANVKNIAEFLLDHPDSQHQTEKYWAIRAQKTSCAQQGTGRFWVHGMGIRRTGMVMALYRMRRTGLSSFVSPQSPELSRC